MQLIKITDNIEFNPELNLSGQSPEFKEWFNLVNQQITDKTVPDSLDEYDRPVSFTIQVGNLVVKVFWLYIFQEKSSWACSDFKIEITR